MPRPSRSAPAEGADVVLMDLVMPGMDGAAATKAIREPCPQTQVLALTSFKEDDLVQGALQAGAIGYLLKNISGDELAAAIRAALRGYGRRSLPKRRRRSSTWRRSPRKSRSAPT